MTCHDAKNETKEKRFKMVATLTYWDWLYNRDRFLLGSSIGIKIGGSSIILILILTGFTTYIVFEALAKWL